MSMSRYHDCALPPEAARRQRWLGRRLTAMVVRPTAPPLWLGIMTAAALITAETVLVHVLREIASDKTFGALFLLGVLVVSAGWGFRLAVATSLASGLVYVYFHLETTGGLMPSNMSDAVAIIVFLPIALLANIVAGQARMLVAESEQRRQEAAALAEQQAALRRVATLVARGVDPSEVYSTAVTELSRGLGIDNVALLRYASDEASVLLACRGELGLSKMHIGARIPLEGENIAAMIGHTCTPARLDSYQRVTGPIAERMRQLRYGRRSLRRSSWAAAYGVPWWPARRSLNPCPRRRTHTSVISPTWWPSPFPMPKPARNSPRHAPASSLPATKRVAASNEICTTAYNSGWCRLGWNCVPSRRRYRPSS
jgi:uncharacterized protein DUF4118